MGTLWYVSHPEVEVDPHVPVPRWGLSDRGRRRAEVLAGRPWLDAVQRVVSSDEAKAVETASAVARPRGLEVEVRPATGENDRRATGFLPPEEFEAVADAFFARPTDSVRGWERAVDAQARIVAALADLVRTSEGGDVLVVGHGAVGTLWACHLAGSPIDRRWDQPGPGHVLEVDRASASLRHHWRRIEDVTG